MGFSRMIPGRAARMALGVLLALAGSCSDDAARRRTLGVAEGCNINSECDDNLICAFRRCHVQCNSDRDCTETGVRCMLSDKPQHVCALADEVGCAGDRDCPGTQVCGVDGECRDACDADGDCIEGQICTSGTCAARSELVSGSLPHAEGGVVDQTGQRCVYNTDCAAPKVCRSGTCLFECVGDRDCPVTSRCAEHRCTAPGPVSPPDAGAGGTGAGGAPGSGGAGGADSGAPSSGGSSGAGGAGAGGRQAAGGADAGGPGCLYNSDCSGGALCRQGQCLPECRQSVDCREGERCDPSGRCVLDPPVGSPPGYGSDCTFTSECALGLVCGASGACRYECQTGADCPATGCCSAGHRCVAASVCLADAGPPPPRPEAGAGPACSGDLDCQDQDRCNGFERCLGGFCRPPLKAACDDENPCTLDTCDDASGACTHVPTVPVDVDGDGHFAVACGNGADDCDDLDPTVHTGHTELCDRADNNCDGRVDEGVWNAGVTVTLPGISGATYTGGIDASGLGAPAMARLSDGTFVVAAAASSLSVHLWKLSAALQVLEGPTAVFVNPSTDGNSTVVRPGIATDGSAFVVSAHSQSYPGGCTHVGKERLAIGGAVAAMTEMDVITASSNQCTGWANWQVGSSPVSVWNGSQYLLAWSDVRDGTRRGWISTLSAGGALGGAKNPLVDATASNVWAGSPGMNGAGRVLVAVGPSSALVAYQYYDGTIGWRVRTVILDRNLGAVFAGPIDLNVNGGDEPRGLSVTHSGSSFVLAASSNGSTSVQLFRLHQTTGATLGQATVANIVSHGDPQLIALSGGVMLGAARGTSVSFGWAPEDITRGGFAMRDVFSDAPVTAATPVAVDPRNAVVVWQDGAVKLVPIVCGP